MIKKSLLALVASSSETLQNGLLSLTTTIPPIGAVLVAEDIVSALRMIENHQPALIILDASLLKVQDVVKQIKNQWPDIRLIVLVEDVIQQKEAHVSGADSVLIKGYSPHKLIAIVENLLENNYPSQSKSEGAMNEKKHQ